MHFRLSSTSTIVAFEEFLLTASPDIKSVEEVVCFGLGRFSSCRISRLQLLTLLRICQVLKKILITCTITANVNAKECQQPVKQAQTADLANVSTYRIEWYFRLLKLLAQSLIQYSLKLKSRFCCNISWTFYRKIQWVTVKIFLFSCRIMFSDQFIS